MEFSCTQKNTRLCLVQQLSWGQFFLMLFLPPIPLSYDTFHLDKSSNWLKKQRHKKRKKDFCSPSSFFRFTFLKFFLINIKRI
ncbi:hypothetical protein AM233_17650 [Bacillus sp. FJAT-22058]|nr:hypothetical protein AM233_17650 [Bacillus sp. FJAT-22058]